MKCIFAFNVNCAARKMCLFRLKLKYFTASCESQSESSCPPPLVNVTAALVELEETFRRK